MTRGIFIGGWVLVACVLVGCSSAPKPPGWPSGEERPINATQPAKVSR
jgi:hypothetical protein